MCDFKVNITGAGIMSLETDADLTIEVQWLVIRISYCILICVLDSEKNAIGALCEMLRWTTWLAQGTIH